MALCARKFSTKQTQTLASTLLRRKTKTQANCAATPYLNTFAGTPLPCQQHLVAQQSAPPLPLLQKQQQNNAIYMLNTKGLSYRTMLQPPAGKTQPRNNTRQRHTSGYIPASNKAAIITTTAKSIADMVLPYHTGPGKCHPHGCQQHRQANHCECCFYSKRTRCCYYLCCYHKLRCDKRKGFKNKNMKTPSPASKCDTAPNIALRLH